MQTIREQVQPPGRRNRMLVMMMNVIILLSASILASSCPLLSGCRSTNIFTNPGSNETIQNIKRQNTDEKTRTGEFFVLFIPKTVRHAVRARVREQRAGAKQSQLSGKICFRTSPVLFLGRSKSGVADKTQERATPTATSDTIETTKDAKSGSRIDAEYSFIIFNCLFFVRRCENK